MARTYKEIRAAIESDFISNTTLIDVYKLDTTKTFDEQFSKVSLEAILISIVASAFALLEQAFDLCKKDVQTAIDNTIVCSIPWYHTQSLNFQYGSALSFDSSRYKVAYDTIDESQRIIKFAAVRQMQLDGITKLRLYVSKSNKAALTSAELTAFKSYIHQIGAAGVHYDIVSQAPSELSFDLSVTYNPQVLASDGAKTDGSYPVRNAISGYLDNIRYGGVFNRTRMIDAIQAAEGVEDVVLQTVRMSGEVVTSQNLEAPGGAFVFNVSSSQISYSVYDY